MLTVDESSPSLWKGLEDRSSRFLQLEIEEPTTPNGSDKPRCAMRLAGNDGDLDTVSRMDGRHSGSCVSVDDDKRKLETHSFAFFS